MVQWKRDSFFFLNKIKWYKSHLIHNNEVISGAKVMVLRRRGVYLLSNYSIMSAVCSMGFSVVSTKINLAEWNNVLEECNVFICMVKVQIFFTIVTNSTVPKQYMSLCTAYMAIMNNLPVLTVSQCCNPQLFLDSGLQKQSYVSFWVSQQDRLWSPGSALQSLLMHCDPETGRTHAVPTKIELCNLQAPIY